MTTYHVEVLNESTGWTLAVKPADRFGAILERRYVSGRNVGSPHDIAEEMAARHGNCPIVWAGNSSDYDREIAAIASDPYFMS